MMHFHYTKYYVAVWKEKMYSTIISIYVHPYLCKIQISINLHCVRVNNIYGEKLTKSASKKNT